MPSHRDTGDTAEDLSFLRRALELAQRGQGRVEPNPMVGCVIVRQGRIIAEGWHQHFGGPHAEIVAIEAATESLVGSTVYVSLEPCCHQGKTPPCCDALIDARVARVVAAMRDPFSLVDGGGFSTLQAAGVEVQSGLLEVEAASLNAPYLCLTQKKRPWMIAKWAMTCDGKIATRTGDSRWISSLTCRQVVHELRGRVDAILVGSGTAIMDNPMLIARPAGSRTATRIVLDSKAKLPITSQLVSTAMVAPTLVAVGPQACPTRCLELERAGCEVLALPEADRDVRLVALLRELGARRMTNVLVEGGGHVLGALFDAQLIDEVLTFVAPIIFGGEGATGAVAGEGVALVNEATRLVDCRVESKDGCVQMWGRVDHSHRKCHRK